LTCKQIELLVKTRDAYQMLVDATNDFIESLAPPEVRSQTAVQETIFNLLKFEAKHSIKFGEYEVAYKQTNLEDKWHQAYSTLKNNNATIKDRYQSDNYQYSYWLYGEDKIYRQKIKPKQTK
jgi:hypothetical protein